MGRFLSCALCALLIASVGKAQQPVPASGTEKELIAVLEADEASVFDKAKACQRLAVVGSDACIPALTSLLPDPKLSHYARTGLEANPSSAVDQAFRDALKSTDNNQLIGVIISIGTRRDQRSVDEIAAFLSSENQAVANAALATLGKLASERAVKHLVSAFENEQLRTNDVADSCLTAIDLMLREDRNQLAADVLQSLREAELPAHIDVASRFAEARVGSVNPSSMIAGYLREVDQHLFRVGLELAHHAESPELTSQLIEMLDDLSIARRVLLIHVLGARGDTKAVPALVEAASSKELEIRVAAVEMLGKIGDKSVLSTLLSAADATEERMVVAAGDSLASLRDESADPKIAAALSTALVKGSRY